MLNKCITVLLLCTTAFYNGFWEEFNVFFEQDHYKSNTSGSDNTVKETNHLRVELIGHHLAKLSFLELFQDKHNPPYCLSKTAVQFNIPFVRLHWDDVRTQNIYSRKIRWYLGLAYCSPHIYIFWTTISMCDTMIENKYAQSIISYRVSPRDRNGSQGIILKRRFVFTKILSSGDYFFHLQFEVKWCISCRCNMKTMFFLSIKCFFFNVANKFIIQTVSNYIIYPSNSRIHETIVSTTCKIEYNVN